jgi:site-specific DNA recombinase
MALAVAPSLAPRAAIYCRVSTDQQEEEGTSLETQEKACREYAARHGYAVDEAHVFVEASSGFRLWERRKITLLRDLVQQRQVDVVVGYALDRLSRKQTHMHILMDEFERHRVRLELVTEKFEATAMGSFLISARAFAAELQRETITECSLRGKRGRLESGRLLRSGRPAFGYRWRASDSSLSPRDRDYRVAYEADPETAPWVRQAFEWAATGWSVRRVAQELNARGVPSPRKRAHWAHTTLRSILTNPSYAGRPQGFRYKAVRTERGGVTMVERPEAERILLPEGVVPALVSSELFEAVQQRLKLNRERVGRQTQHPEIGLLRGGFARCGECGGTLSPRRTGPGGKFWQYRCIRGMSLDPRCKGTHISVPLLDAAVWARVEALLLQPGVIERELAKQQHSDPTTDDLAAIDATLAKLRRQQENLIDQLANVGGNVAKLVTTKLAEMDAQQSRHLVERETLLKRRAAWEIAQQRIQELETWCQDVAANLGDLDMPGRRLALDALGVQATIWRTGHTPRWEVTAGIPLTDGNEANLDESSPRSAGRSSAPPSSGRLAPGSP